MVGRLRCRFPFTHPVVKYTDFFPGCAEVLWSRRARRTCVRRTYPEQCWHLALLFWSSTWPFGRRFDRRSGRLDGDVHRVHRGGGLRAACSGAYAIAVCRKLYCQRPAYCGGAAASSFCTSFALWFDWPRRQPAASARSGHPQLPVAGVDAGLVRANPG